MNPRNIAATLVLIALLAGAFMYFDAVHTTRAANEWHDEAYGISDEIQP